MSCRSRLRARSVDQRTRSGKRRKEESNMPQPLVIAYHLIWTAYGWWLPNDPRGSGSKTIDSDIIAELGELHHGRKRVQPPGRVVRQFYEKAAKFLKHPLLKLDEPARKVVAGAFEE